MNVKRIGCIVLAGVAAVPLAVFAGVAIGEIPPRDPITQAEAEAAIRREEAFATSLGLTLVEGHPRTIPTDGAVPPLDLALSAGECVAIVVGAWGNQQIESAFVVDPVAGPQLVLDAPLHALAAHAQWCTDRVGTFRVHGKLRRRNLYGSDTSGFVQTRVYRGWGSTFGGLAKLRRGEITIEGARSLAPTTFASEATRDAPQPWPQTGPDVTIPDAAAVLVPESVATYRELHRHALNGSGANVSPRVAPLALQTPPAWRPLAQMGLPTDIATVRRQATPQPPSGPHFPFLEDDGVRRVLAVIDGRRLGARCHELQFVRMLYGRVAQVRSHPVNGAASELISSRNVAHRTQCANHGMVTYSVPATDRERYLLRLYARSP